MVQGSSSRSRVAVIGAGAIGGFFAAKLQEAGHEVTLCVRTPIESLVLEQAGERRTVPVQIVTDPALQKPVAWVFVATKAQDTAGAEPWLQALSNSGTTVVVLQNGIDQAERVKPFAPGSVVVPAVVYCGAERVSPGTIVHHQSSRLIIPEGDVGRRLTELFSGTDVEVAPTPDFLTASWRKLLANVAANPITALTMRRIGVLREPDVHDLAEKLLAEAVAVGRAAGAHLTPEDARSVLAAQCRLDEGAGTSMLYDRLAGQPLEHEYITGPVVRTADRQGVDAPLNRAIFVLLRALSARLVADR
jgi:2-dehydropantoate 2-reductase